MRFSALVMLILVAVVAVVGIFVLWANPFGGPALSAADMTATQLCVVATSEGGRVIVWEVFGTPTPGPNSTVTPTPPAGDVARGQTLFNGGASCNACHSTTSMDQTVGPPLMHIASVAQSRRPGVSAEDYIRGVIMDPNTAVPLSKPGVMPITYWQTLTPQQISDIVAYLMTMQ